MNSPLKNEYLFQKKIWRIIIKAADICGNKVIRPFISKKEYPAEYKKVLFSKIDHLGDLILLLQILPQFHKNFPATKIHFLIGSWAKLLFDGNKFVEKIIIYDDIVLDRDKKYHKKIIKWLVSIWKVIFLIRKEKYDLAVDFRAYFPNTIPLLFLAGVKYRAGFGTAGFGFLLQKQAKWTPNVHETQHYLELLKAININIKPLNDEKYFDYLLKKRSKLVSSAKKGYGKYIVVHPCSADKNKNWQQNKWREFAKAFPNRSILFVGSKKEKIYIGEITQGLNNSINLAGETNISELAGILKNASLVAGVESFVCHLAAALGTPCIIIASGIADISQWMPLKNSGIVNIAVKCSPCFSSSGCKDMLCMDIPARTVIGKCKELL